MLDINKGILPLTEFKQKSSAIISQVQKTKNPAVLTVNGRAQAVLIDPESYQNMVNQIALLRSADQITASLIEMENDEGIESDVFFKKLRKKFLK